MTDRMELMLLDRAAVIQRREIETQLRRLRFGRLVQDMKFCPLCHPELFDACLDFTPTPLYCRSHAAHFLARCGITMHRDEGNTAQPTPQGLEVQQCA